MNQVFWCNDVLSNIVIRNINLYWKLVQISLNLALHRVYYAQILTVKTVIQHDNHSGDCYILLKEGDFVWTLNGKLHRENDLPAIEGVNGDKEWYQNGKKHRDYGPAIKRVDGSEGWYQYDKLHRDNDLPAIKLSNGSQSWWQHGQLHREGGPASIKVVDGRFITSWFKQGKRTAPKVFNVKKPKNTNSLDLSWSDIVESDEDE